MKKSELIPEHVWKDLTKEKKEEILAAEERFKSNPPPQSRDIKIKDLYDKSRDSR